MLEQWKEAEEFWRSSGRMSAMNRYGTSRLLLAVGLGPVFAGEPVLRAGLYSVSLKATEARRCTDR